jgi:hypothetical protein
LVRLTELHIDSIRLIDYEILHFLPHDIIFDASQALPRTLLPQSVITMKLSTSSLTL